MNKEKIINKISINKVLDGISSPKSIVVYDNSQSLIENTNSIQLGDGKEILEIPIGRETPGLDLKDNKYLSKNQVELNINKDDQSISFIVKGVNPTYLISSKDFSVKKDSKEIKDILGKELETNISYKINNGDILSFLLPNQTTSIQFNIDALEKEIKKEEKERSLNNNNNNSDNNSNNVEKKEEIKKMEQNKRKLDNSEKMNDKPLKQPSASWADKLLVYCDSPKENGALYYDDKIVIISDKYPKSKYHFLVLPRKHILKHRDLTKEDVGLLEYMFVTGNKYLEDSVSPAEKKSISIGFHAIPSMRQLHMHMISNDYQTAALKKKEHWNSFTTEFFIPFESFYKQVKEKGSFNKINIKFKY
ncbi:hypothetical protein DICPUDRAFT_153568 [Dictyostelium purpureum]|uniref:HIT domain-containing protein n=1 Tax=Dictyostelium purpureum TaxID=5786 RepID=F0ZP77_DICPU|nr:uncharacterized protein DICPUDRAFT_153568 [Dictyostelium purpureum]EGC34247.1 hypothetical protein DICPUDRAFT_153568 [Dictyostelium purpureum]|eukprot:XP_003289216.1 hypothetical protein DICPUDRAFT_153568 [Dictyostelium purpureum]